MRPAILHQPRRPGNPVSVVTPRAFLILGWTLEKCSLWYNVTHMQGMCRTRQESELKIATPSDAHPGRGVSDLRYHFHGLVRSAGEKRQLLILSAVGEAE